MRQEDNKGGKELGEGVSYAIRVNPVREALN